MSSDELVDVVDESDRVIGQAVRHEVRRNNLRHRSVYVLVFNSAGQLFVHRRTLSKDVFPGHWDVAVGGVLNAGEGYDEGARRELHEELGVTGLTLRRLFPLRFEDAHNRVAGVVYSCTSDGPFHLQASEIAEGRWMDLDVLLDRTQHDPFCPDGLEALRLYLIKLDQARNRR
ncbi:MAG TPA: NUDIX hydrolase YfcD [Candidatus Margulisiibacteriota bacterium]|nr:NUDIX hydrolase YfcD [Candidatus Margulisiibacteriota bacterium]